MYISVDRRKETKVSDKNFPMTKVCVWGQLIFYIDPYFKVQCLNVERNSKIKTNYLLMNTYLLTQKNIR